MKVEQLKEKYEALQKEGNDIYAQIKPLLKRLKALSKKCMKLGNKADTDKGLYDHFRRVLGENAEGEEIVDEMARCTNGWDTSILFRLWDFDCLVNDPNRAIDAIDNVLYNLKHTKFKKI